MSLKEMSLKVQELKKIAESEKDLVPGLNFNAKLGKVRRAQEDLSEIFSKYRDAIRTNSVLIITTGEGSEDFANIAKTECGCFTSNLEDMFDIMTNSIPESSYKGRAAGHIVYDTFNVKLEEIANDVGLRDVPNLQFTNKEGYVLQGKEDLNAMAKNAVYGISNGAVLPLMFGINAVTEQAITSAYLGNSIPVVIHTNDTKDLQTIVTTAKTLTKNVFLVTVGKVDNKDVSKNANYKIKAVTSESVEKTLGSIAETIKQ